MQEDTGIDEEFRLLIAGLAKLREGSLIDGLRHDSLKDTMVSAKNELDALDAYFRQRLAPTAATDIAAIARARSVLVRSCATICRYQSDFDTTMLKHRMNDNEIIRSCFEWMTGALLERLERFAMATNMSGWDVSVSAGLPAGFSFSVTLSFNTKGNA